MVQTTTMPVEAAIRFTHPITSRAAEESSPEVGSSRKSTACGASFRVVQG